MDAYLLDWAQMLLRWLHVITAIAWIGSSFYFVFLDSNLLPPTDPEQQAKGVSGQMWAVHGGGFYNPQKYLVAPPRIDSKLHWFYWESYSTWLSGFALFTLLYLAHASTYLVDTTKMDWSAGAAVGIALVFLTVFGFVYDVICGVVGFRKHGDLIIGVLTLIWLAFLSWLACKWFAGRAAFLLMGAAVATAMTANVLLWIIPGQRKVVAAMTSGQPYDAQALAIYGQRGKQRSVHNTYFTLPVVFAMLSNHYSFLTNAQHNWLVLLAMMLGGALIRQFFVQRHAYHHGRARHPWPWALLGVLMIAAVIVALKPDTTKNIAASALNTRTTAVNDSKIGTKIGYTQLQTVLVPRCIQCHGAVVQMKNVRLDSPEAVKQHAQAVYLQAVITKQMPMNNATGITDAERALIKQWFESGAKVD
jgi:uncharacterized membrane protein